MTFPSGPRSPRPETAGGHLVIDHQVADGHVHIDSTGSLDGMRRLVAAVEEFSREVANA